MGGARGRGGVGSLARFADAWEGGGREWGEAVADENVRDRDAGRGRGRRRMRGASGRRDSAHECFT